MTADDTKQSVNSFTAAFGFFTNLHEFILLNFRSSKQSFLYNFSTIDNVIFSSFDLQCVGLLSWLCGPHS